MFSCWCRCLRIILAKLTFLFCSVDQRRAAPPGSRLVVEYNNYMDGRIVIAVNVKKCLVKLEAPKKSPRMNLSKAK